MKLKSQVKFSKVSQFLCPKVQLQVQDFSGSGHACGYGCSTLYLVELAAKMMDLPLFEPGQKVTITFGGLLFSDEDIILCLL